MTATFANETVIGLFGGAFDPIHFGHLRPALEVMEHLQLSEVRFIPAYQSPGKPQARLTAQQRADMVAEAIAAQPGFVLERCELDRAGPSYTVDTLRELRQRLGDTVSLLLLMGTDAFVEMPNWHAWQQLLQLAHIVVMQRPDSDWSAAAFPTGYLQQRLTARADALRRQPHGHIFKQEVSQLGISSTMIRARLQAGGSIRYLVPEPQANFIHTNRLYQTTSL